MRRFTGPGLGGSTGAAFDGYLAARCAGLDVPQAQMPSPWAEINPHPPKNPAPCHLPPRRRMIGPALEAALLPEIRPVLLDLDPAACRASWAKDRFVEINGGFPPLSV